MKNIIYRIEFDLIELMESRSQERRPYTGDRRPEMENRSLEHRPNIRYRRPEMVNRSSEWSPNIRDRAVEMENRSWGRRPYPGDRTAEMENWSSERRPKHGTCRGYPAISYRRMEMVNRRHFPQLVPLWEFQNPNII